MRAFYVGPIYTKSKILIEVQNKKLRENVSDDSYLKTYGRTDVTKLIVASHFAIALSQPLDLTRSLQEIISYFQIYQMSNGVSWTLGNFVLENSLPTPMH